MDNDQIIKIAVIGGLIYFLTKGDKTGKHKVLQIPPEPIQNKTKKLSDQENSRGVFVANLLTEVLNETYYLDASPRCEAYKKAVLLTDRSLVHCLNRFAAKNKNESVLSMMSKTNANGCNEIYGIDWEKVLINRITKLTARFDANGKPYDYLPQSLKKQADEDILRIRKMSQAILAPSECDFRLWLLHRTDTQLFYISTEYKKKYPNSYYDGLNQFKRSSICLLHADNLVDFAIDRLQKAILDVSS